MLHHFLRSLGSITEVVPPSGMVDSPLEKNLASLANDMGKPQVSNTFKPAPQIPENESSKGKHPLHVSEFDFDPHLSVHGPSSSCLMAGGDFSVLNGGKPVSDNGKQVKEKSFLSTLCGALDMLDDVVFEAPNGEHGSKTKMCL